MIGMVFTFDIFLPSYRLLMSKEYFLRIWLRMYSITCSRMNSGILVFLFPNYFITFHKEEKGESKTQETMWSTCLVSERYSITTN